MEAIESKAAGDGPHTGGMVALVPSPEVAREFAVDGGELPNELHITLAFLGTSADIAETAKLAIVDKMNKVAQTTGQIDARPFAVNIFNPRGDEPCIVLGVGGQQLDDVHTIVSSMLSDPLPGFTMPDNHAPWVPHMTLQYFPDGNIDYNLVQKVAAGLPESLPLSYLRVAFGGNYTDFPLSGDPVPADGNADEGDSSEVKPTTLYEKMAGLDSSKCKFCDANATRKLVGDNDKTIFTCAEHTDDGKEWFSAMTEEDNVAVQAKADRLAKLKEPQKCKYCDSPATHSILHSEGRAYVAACDKHMDKAKDAASDSTPDGTRDPSNIDKIYKIEEKVVRHVRTPAGVRRYDQPIGSVIVGDGHRLPNLREVTSQYEGYNEYDTGNGNHVWTSKESGKYVAYDEASNVLGEDSSEENLLKRLDAAAGAAKKKGGGVSAGPGKPVEKPTGPTVSNGPGFKKVKSEYAGYDQYEGDNGKTLWSYKDGSQHVIVDADNNEVEIVGRNELLGALHRLLKKDDGGDKPKSEVTFEVGKAKGPGIGWQVTRHETTPDGRKISTFIGIFPKQSDAQGRADFLQEREVEIPGSSDPKHPDYKPHHIGDDPRTGKPKTPAAKSATRDLTKYPNLTSVESDYEGWDKFNGADGKPYYISDNGDGTWTIADASKDLDTKPNEASALNYLNFLSRKKDVTKRRSKPTSPPTIPSGPSTNGSKEGVGGQGHVPSDLDKVVLSKPRELQPGMMVNIGNGGWKRIGLVGKETRTSWFGGRGASTAGQYTVFDPWGEPIAIMSPNNTVEVDEGAGIAKDMMPKIRRKPWPNHDQTYIEVAPGVAGHENPFVDGYPDFDPYKRKVPGTPIRYEITATKGEFTVSRYERGKEDQATVISKHVYEPGDKIKRSEAEYAARGSMDSAQGAEAAKLGKTKYSWWSVPSQKRRDERTRKAKNTTTAPKGSVPEVPKPDNSAGIADRILNSANNSRVRNLAQNVRSGSVTPTAAIEQLRQMLAGSGLSLGDRGEIQTAIQIIREGLGNVGSKAVVVTPGGRVGDNARHGSRSNGTNWVERTAAGALPEYIRIVRNGLMKHGHTEGQATALAVAAIKKWAHGGGNVSPKVQAAAAKALAEWEAMKAEKLNSRILDLLERKDSIASIEAGVDSSARTERRRRNTQSRRRHQGQEDRSWNRKPGKGGKFDESKHPRKGGKFAPKGSASSSEGDSSRNSSNSSTSVKKVPDSWKKRLPIKYGEQGSHIERLQEVLDGIPGVPKTEKDGIYGEKTKAAVAAFQKQAGLKETGVLDEATFAAIINYQPSK